LPQGGQYHQPGNITIHEADIPSKVIIKAEKILHKYLSRMWAEFYCCHALWFTKLKIVTSKRSEITASKSKHQHLETIALVTITKGNTNNIENKLLVKSDSKKTKKLFVKLIVKTIFAAVYSIWKERNARLSRNESKD
jgi:hypothetical protein